MSSAPPPGALSLPARSRRRHTLAGDLRVIARDFWRFRELLQELALRDVRVKYKQAVLGFAWALFVPVVVVLAGALTRVLLARAAGVPIDSVSIAGLAVKAVAWAFFVGALTTSMNSVAGNLQLLTKVYFPREVLPVAAVLGQMVDLGVALVALLVLLPALGVMPAPAAAWVPVLLLLLVLLTTGAGLLLSSANLFFRDVKHIVQVLLTFGIFFVPVFFEPSGLGARAGALIMLNPVAPVLEGLRLALVEGHNLLHPLLTPDGRVVWVPWHLAYTAAWAVGGLIASAVLFHRSEFLFAERI